MQLILWLLLAGVIEIIIRYHNAKHRGKNEDWFQRKGRWKK